MADDIPPDIDIEPFEVDPHCLPGTEVQGDYVSKGTQMLEVQSYEHMVEGLKCSADRMRHLAARREDGAWASLATIVDKSRFVMVRHYGLHRAEDLVCHDDKTIYQPMPRKQAYEEMRDGLERAAKACRQLATCFRSDLWWSNAAAGLDKIRKQARILATVRTDVTAQVLAKQRYMQ